jgi:hypothetical protein
MDSVKSGNPSTKKECGRGAKTCKKESTTESYLYRMGSHGKLS